MARSSRNRTRKKAHRIQFGTFDPARLARLGIEVLEDRLAPAGLFTFQATRDLTLTLRVSNQDLQVVDTQNPAVVLASQQVAETTGVQVAAGNLNVSLTVDASVPPLATGVEFVGGAGTN